MNTNLIKKIFFISSGFILSTQSNLLVFGAETMSFGTKKITNPGVKGSDEPVNIAIQAIITKLASFLSILAVVYALWGGFQILTSAGEEEKVKKGKNVLIQALIGLVIIWLSYSIVFWLTDSILSK